MKLSYFFAFLLLVDQTLSVRIPPSLTKAIYKETRDTVFQYAWEQGLDEIKQMFSPQQPNTPPKQIQGLSRIKVYFSNFGYIQSSGPFDDYLDQQTVSAFKTYQKHFNLQVTGDLSDETYKEILLPRCAVPDVNFDYVFTGDVSWPKSGNRWFPKGRNITYGFLPESEIPSTATKVFRDSFARRSVALGVLSFTETAYDEADIKVGFYIFGDSVGDEVLGGSIIRMQLASNVKAGEIRLDGTKLWLLPSEYHSLSWEGGILDLESVAMHQIGHLLGLDHSNDEDSVMYPYVLPSQQRKVELSNSDKDNIQQQNSSGNSGHEGCWGVLLVFALGFAYLLL